MNFSTSYSSSPNLKVSFSGNDYRSWIDIVVLYHKVVKDISSLFDIEYLHRTIHLSNDSGTYSIMNTLPNGGDQVLVFIADNPINHAWKPLDMIITGRSYQIYEPLDHTVHFNGKPKLILWWNAQLQIVSGLHSYISLHGESHQLEVYFTHKCQTNKTCPGLKVYWIPDQLSKYKDDVHNKPHICLPHQSSKYKNVIHTKSSNYLSLYDPVKRCLNFSSDSTKPHYVYYANQYSFVSLTLSPEVGDQMSWNYASSFCQNVGGCLPIIRSKSELDAFIAFVTLSKHLPVQQKIFIGFILQR